MPERPSGSQKPLSYAAGVLGVIPENIITGVYPVSRDYESDNEHAMEPVVPLTPGVNFSICTFSMFSLCYLNAVFLPAGVITCTVHERQGS